ncbi:hypothetical protein P3X46_009441 [Hevea brasiliensis]|uniref:Pre-rRNA-processing protein Ipi1 N-terminal domain-containing protein n=3 Tax=Hevea brasiliensis TaxID=3981 RepID=A0ABQ9MMC5_HEVBR|nr:uncharacterized protein LOC110634708 isoform X2 [Hevea brasiliensis]XP_021639518.2 uncharacterized protein LOC110634708 isoform X2 [Hevea brasiliensis]KAJ9181301.1 hypothetical protein P3X46_009441 [Hevea brasiliensis]
MAKTKASSKKQQKRGVDFKKIKRKLGRKLPPPKNATNTEIKSKAIILPEQSVASEKMGLAVSKKGLTLKELLHQTSHHNAKVRKDALMGMKDLFLKYPEELKLHRYAVIEKLRERISDEDKMVREALYQLLNSVILPSCNEDNQRPFISLMMAYIFNAMTHLAIEVRLMAFKFFDLIVQHYPAVFPLYAEKVLQNYADILRKNQFYLEDKGKLKSALAGLVHCLLLLPSNKVEVDSFKKVVPRQDLLHAYEPDRPTKFADFSVIINELKDFVPVLVNCFQAFIPLIHSAPQLDAQSFDCLRNILHSIDLIVRFFVYATDKGNPESYASMWDQGISSVLLKKFLGVFPFNAVHSEKDDDRYFSLNVMIAEIFLHLSEWIYPPAELLEKFLAFIEHALLEKIHSETRSGRAVREKQILTLVHFIPKLVAHVIGNWKSRLLKAFTKTFLDCNPESSVKLACLTAIEEMLFSRKGMWQPDGCDSEVVDPLITWIRELPVLLILLSDRHPSSSKVVLHLLLCMGQCSTPNSLLALEYDNMQYSLQKFYCTYREGDKCYGPFIGLPRDSQELSIFCLYYFSHLDALLLKSIASCCLCPDLDEFVLFRIVEVLHSAFKAGHIEITDHFSFFVTLVSRFNVFPENISPAIEEDTKISNRGTFKKLICVVCSCLEQMGDASLVLLILEGVILEQILLKPPLDNARAMLRMLVVLDSKPTRLSEQSIITLSNFLSGYLIDVVHCVRGDDAEPMEAHVRAQMYYIVPCFFLFDRSRKLLHLVLNGMGSLITKSTTGHSSRINDIVSVLMLMHRDAKMKQIISSSRAEIDHISQSIRLLQSEESSLTVGERHRMQRALEQLKTVTSSLDQ